MEQKTGDGTKRDEFSGDANKWENKTDNWKQTKLKLLERPTQSDTWSRSEIQMGYAGSSKKSKAQLLFLFLFYYYYYNSYYYCWYYLLLLSLSLLL